MTRRSGSARPLFLLAAIAAAVVIASVFMSAGGSPRTEAQAPLPAETNLAALGAEVSGAPTASPPPATPAPYIPDEVEVEMLARVLWGEARGVPSEMEKAAVVWCVLNRVDAGAWPDTVAEVVEQPKQFQGYAPDNPATEELKALAADVLTRWEWERQEGGDVGRVLPAGYYYFTGDGVHNYFRTEFMGGTLWDWTLTNPYRD